MTDLMTHGPTALGHDPVTGLPMAPPVVTDLSSEGLLALAINKGLPVESIEKLIMLNTQMRAAQAKREFDESFARFQQECPIIMKAHDVVTEKYRYKYASIDQIVAVVQPLLTKHGFSYSFDSVDEVDPPAKVCVMVMRHAGGHSERSSFRVEIENTGRRNKSQEHASAMTYAKRYTFTNGWGIMTGEEDDDAKKAGERHQQLRNGDAKVTLVPDPERKDQPKTKATSAKRSPAPSTISQAQQDLLRDRSAQLAETYKLTPEEGLQAVIDHCGTAHSVTSLEQLSPAQCTEVLGWMLAMRRAKSMNQEAKL